MRELEDYGFVVFAENLAEGVGDFADGGVGFNGGEDGREKIFRGAGATLEFDESGLDFGGIPLGAEGVEAGDLSAFDLQVDAQGGDLAIFFGDEVVDAYYDLLFLFDGALEIVGGTLDFGLNESGVDGFEHAAE